MTEDRFSIRDLSEDGSKPVQSNQDLRSILTRGQERMIKSLLATAIERPLDQDEIDQLKMLYRVKEPTQEFSKIVLSQGREE